MLLVLVQPRNHFINIHLGGSLDVQVSKTRHMRKKASTLVREEEKQKEKIGTLLKRKLSEELCRGGTFCHLIIFTPACTCVRALLLVRLHPVSQRNDPGNYA